MAITTLLSIMLVGGAVIQSQTPTIIDIQTKCYAVTQEKFEMGGKKVTVRPIAGGSVANWQDFDEGKLTKRPNLKLINAPTIRTLEGRQASLTYTTASSGITTAFSLSYLPNLQSSGKIGLDLKFIETTGDEKNEVCSYSTSAVMGEQSQAWVISRNKTTNLYIVKVTVADPIKQ